MRKKNKRMLGTIVLLGDTTLHNQPSLNHVLIDEHTFIVFDFSFQVVSSSGESPYSTMIVGILLLLKDLTSRSTIRTDSD